MNHLDQFGVAQTTVAGEALGYFDAAVAKLLIFNNDPLAEADKALAVDPHFVMAHVVKGVLFALSTERSLLPRAVAALAAARPFAAGASPREQDHLAALEAWTEGRLRAAAAHWEHALRDQPRDALAMFCAHQTDFLLGDSRELRDRVARRLPAVDDDARLSGYYRGMHAFGLEEMGEYARAEDAGRQAVAADRKDAWAIHAVAHICEMTGRSGDGQLWLADRSQDWAEQNFLAIHNWWHLGLFYCEQQRWGDALQLYDVRLRDGESAVVMNLLDASSLLWRLTLQDVDVGARWERLAHLWEPHLDEGWYAFNDLHAMMVFAAARRRDLASRLLGVMQVTGAAATANGATTRGVGLPVAAAFLATAEGRFAEAVDLLVPVMSSAAGAGGSHAQRDVIEQTLAIAAERAGRYPLARTLLAARLTRKPDSLLNRAWMQRLDNAQNR